MLADTTDELLAMARQIGVSERWLQHAGTPKEHFDVCQAKRALALRAGARELCRRGVAEVLRRKREAAGG